MRLIKIIPILLVLSLYNSASFAEDCSEIKMDSSVNILKKIKCKADLGGSSADNSSADNSSAAAETEAPKEKKDGIFSKLFQKPKWMK